MALSWNEIKSRAVQFSKEWENEASEDAEAKSFLDGFFNVFGISRRRVASFEQNVHLDGDRNGYIDLIWKGVLLIEQKSKGKDLDKAFKQATDYFTGLKENELPKYILVSDFDRFRLYDLEENIHLEFHLKDLYKNIRHFGFIAGYQKQISKPEDPVNIHAAELMGKLHDMLKAVGYTGHQLEVYLVRLLFCLFADDTTIFDKGIFEDFIRNSTKEDGSDLAPHLSELFYVLNTDKRDRLKNLDETLNAFPYVNGKLFEVNLSPASFDSKMRLTLLDCCSLNWGKISPAIFGSMFQSVMNPAERRGLGAHYTSEKNILRLIKPLFLDDLYIEFEKVKDNRNRLVDFHKKLSTLKFLDPACGCGNFLVITYRELRLLEIEILRILYKNASQIIVEGAIWIDVDQFYGIEYDDWPAQIAQVAMWLIDHQMNMKISEEFGEYFVRLPLKKSATIVHGNALHIDWESILSKKELSYILGNPPFIGTAYQTAEQKNDLIEIFKNVKSYGMLDYVTCWYVKAAQYIQDTKIKVAYVSTNSIAQGEQVGILWNELFSHYSIKIHFAHQTFKWNNESKGKAAVHVVIIGFANFNTPKKFIYEYESISGEPHELKVKNINPYLVEGRDLCLLARTNPICSVPKIGVGSAFLDGGFLILSNEEKDELVKNEPLVKKYIRLLLSAEEFINNTTRWCLWLKDITPKELKESPNLSHRIEMVKEFRLKSKRGRTKDMANYPTLIGEERQPNSDYLLIPKVSSVNRKYIPIGVISKNVIATDKVFVLPQCSLFHFGIITSAMHMAWMKYTGGRLKSDYSYSNTIVYNNYPWPEKTTDKQKQVVEDAVQKVLDARKQFPNNSLADLYDPFTMPPVLSKAHQELDKAVDRCYRPNPFESETKRIEYLFELYEKYTAGLFAGEVKKKNSIKK